MLLIAPAFACPWSQEMLAAGAIAALASPARWDAASDEDGRRLGPRALSDTIEHDRAWHLRPTLFDTHPHDLIVTLFDMDEDVRTNIGIWSDGAAEVLAWREHRNVGEREVYTQDRIVAWGLVDGHAVAYWSFIFPDRTVYKGISESCR